MEDSKTTSFGFSLGTWNVRYFSEASKLEQTCKEMDRYKLVILGLAETRWIGQGKVLAWAGHRFLYSGNPQFRLNGVGILISPQVSASLLEYKSISDRPMLQLRVLYFLNLCRHF